MKTFVVRLFMPIDPAPRPAGAMLHGRVEEIGSDRQATFAGGQQLLAFLAAKAEHGADVSGGSSS